MNFSILSILLSFIFGFIFVAYLRRFDVYEKEPYLKMILATLIGGIISIVVCTLLYEIIDRTMLSTIETRSFLGSILIIGPVEEIAKLVGLFAVWPFIRKEINEVNDGLVYMACVALGFSLIENYFYAISTPETHYLLYYRLFITSPAHIIMSMFIGIAFYRVMYKGMRPIILGYAIVWSSLIHGLYDGFIFEDLGMLSIVVFILAIQQAILLIKVSNIRSPHKVPFEQILALPRKQQDLTTVCPSCHTYTKSSLIQYRSIRLYSCPQCKVVYSDKRHLIRLYHYYIPNFGLDLIRMRKVKLLGKNSQLYTYRKLFFFTSKKEKLGYFEAMNFIRLIEVYRRYVINDFRARWYSPGRYIAVFNKK